MPSADARPQRAPESCLARIAPIVGPARCNGGDEPVDVIVVPNILGNAARLEIAPRDCRDRREEHEPGIVRGHRDYIGDISGVGNARVEEPLELACSKGTTKLHGLYDLTRVNHRTRQASVVQDYISGIIGYIETHPGEHAAALMKRKNSLRNAVYAQVVWAIHELGLADGYEMPVSTLRIRKKSTGQLILFAGCDDPHKSK